MRMLILWTYVSMNRSALMPETERKQLSMDHFKQLLKVILTAISSELMSR